MVYFLKNRFKAVLPLYEVMERLWSYKELKEIRLKVDLPSEYVAEHLNRVFHEGAAVRDKSGVERVKRNLHVLFR
jgi:hypothetical protein